MKTVQVKRANIARLTTENVGEASNSIIQDSKKALINEIIEKVPEVGSNDRKNITTIVGNYLKTTKTKIHLT